MESKSFRWFFLIFGLLLVIWYWPNLQGSFKDKNLSAVGNLSRTFELPTVNSTSPSFKISDHLGQKVIILNFFATWCGPCRAEMPEFEKFYIAHKEKDMILVAIDAGEDKETVSQFIQQLGLTLPVVLDPQDRVSELFRIRGLPTTVVIGKDEKILLHRVGAIFDPEKTLSPFL